jgi:hypothetical protein
MLGVTVGPSGVEFWFERRLSLKLGHFRGVRVSETFDTDRVVSR